MLRRHAIGRPDAFSRYRLNRSAYLANAEVAKRALLQRGEGTARGTIPAVIDAGDGVVAGGNGGVTLGLFEAEAFGALFEG